MFVLAEDEVLSRTRGLEAELAEARSKIKQLESRIETDALLTSSTAEASNGS